MSTGDAFAKGLSGAQVREVRFAKPPIGKRGYAIAEVDAFLDIAAAAFDGAGSPLHSVDVRNTVFRKPPIGQRGYDEGSVDAFLDRVEQECQRRFG